MRRYFRGPLVPLRYRNDTSDTPSKYVISPFAAASCTFISKPALTRRTV